MKSIKRRHVRTGSGVLLVLGLLAGVSHAATLPGEAPRLADLLRVDALGYECIAESDLDAAFRATGKPFHLPRTCLPDPCERRLTRSQLAGIIGRPPTDALWEDYLVRYADACLDPAPWSGATPAASRPDPATFWTPLLVTADRSTPSLRRLPGGFTGGGPVFLGPTRPRIGSPGDAPERPVEDIFAEAPQPAPPTPAPPSPIPLPPALALLLAGLVALGWRRGHR